MYKEREDVYVTKERCVCERGCVFDMREGRESMCIYRESICIYDKRKVCVRESMERVCVYNDRNSAVATGPSGNLLDTPI